MFFFWLQGLNFKTFGRFHKQLGFGKLNVKSPSKECKQLLKEKQEEDCKASDEALDRFEVTLGKLMERLSNKEETFLLVLAINAFVEAGKGLIAFNFREERAPCIGERTISVIFFC